MTYIVIITVHEISNNKDNDHKIKKLKLKKYHRKNIF